MSDIVNCRQQVVEMLNNEQRQLHSVRSRTAKADIETQIEWFNQRVKVLDGEIDQLRQQHQAWQQQHE